MADISYAFAFIVGTFLECMMYGVFFALITAVCYVQWDKHTNGRGVNRVMVFTIVLLGFMITTSCVLSVYRSLGAIFSSGETIDQYLGPPHPTVEKFRLSFLQYQIVVADIIMVHRMYYVYGKNFKVCIIPTITVAALFAVVCGTTNQLRDLSTSHSQKVLGTWASASFCLAIFNSLFITVAISLRLWRVHRGTARANVRSKGSVLLRVMKVLIESAALWTAFVMMNFLAFLAGSNLVFIFLAMTGPAIGISFCLIIVRLGHILPEPREEEGWNMSIRGPNSQTPRPAQLSIPFSREVFTSDPKEYPVETESSKAEYADPEDSPKVIRASLNFSSPAS